MAKEKQTRRMIAMALAAAVTMSSVPVVAFADEVEGGESTGTVTVTVTATPTTTTTETKTDISTNDTSDDGNTTTNYEGHKTETSVTEGTTEGADGTPVTTPTTDTKIDTSFDNTLADGELSKSQTTDETTTTVEKTADGTVETVVNEKTENSVSVDAEGNVIETTNESGSETITTTTDATEEDLEGVELPEVTVDFSAENDTNPNDDKITVEVTEKVQVSEAQKSDILENGVDIGDKTVIEEIERIVKAELSATTTTDNSTATIVPGVHPEEYADKLYSDLYTKYQNEKGQWYSDPNGLYPYDDVTNDFYGPDVVNTPPAEGFEFQASGYGDVTDAASPVTMYIYYQKDPVTGEALKDADGNYIIDEEKSYLINPGDKNLHSGMDEQPSQIVVRKPNADGTGFDYFYTYCVDKDTGVGKNTDWYQVTDIEDANYYSDEAAAHIRAIAENGYWGTAEGTGSIAQMKEMLRKYAATNPTVEIVNENNEKVSVPFADLIDGLKEHEALAVTQAALWSYSNFGNVLNGEDGEAIIGVQSAVKYYNYNESTGKYSSLLQYDRDYDLESDTRMAALYECLMSLAPKDASTQVDLEDETKFIGIEDTSLVIGDKADSFIVVDDVTGESVDVNKDNNADNDAYNTSVQFTLAVVPDQKNDDLVVLVMDKDGNTVAAKRLAGENSGDENYDTIAPDNNGVYTINGLVFQENSDVQFDLKLEGLHNLGDKGVYIFQAYGGTDQSQTLVGLGERVQDVDVTKSMTLSFDVDENKKVTATSTWSKSSRKVTPPTEDPTTPPGGDNPPGGGGSNPPGGDTDIPDGDVPLSDIPEEDVPLADIGEEDVPLADIGEEEVPLVAGEEEVIAATGDSNHMTAGFGGMLAALAGMFMLRRKKEN